MPAKNTAFSQLWEIGLSEVSLTCTEAKNVALTDFGILQLHKRVFTAHSYASLPRGRPHWSTGLTSYSQESV